MTDEELYQNEVKVFEALEKRGRPKEVLRNWALQRAESSMTKPKLYNDYIALAEKYS